MYVKLGSKIERVMAGLRRERLCVAEVTATLKALGASERCQVSLALPDCLDVARLWHAASYSTDDVPGHTASSLLHELGRRRVL